MISKQCKAHLEENNMTAWQHLKFAWGLAWACFTVMLALLIHGLAPRWFDHYASNRIKAMNQLVSEDE